MYRTFAIFTFFTCLSVRDSIARRPRICRKSSLAIYDRERNEIEMTHEHTLKGTPNDLKLIVTIKWDVPWLNNSEYDGVLVRMRVGAGYSSAGPYNDCEASDSHLWIRTKNVSECGNINYEMLPCYSRHASSEEWTYCPCDKETCPVLASINCYGSRKMRDERFGKYYAVPNTRRSISYQVDFNVMYVFEIYFYDRQYASYIPRRRFIKPNYSCAEMVSAFHGMAVVDALSKCCESNITALAPMDLIEGDIFVDRSTRTLNMTVSWIPPSPSDASVVIFSAIRVKDIMGYNHELPQITEYETIGTAESDARCSRDNRRQVATIYNLLPNTEYIVYLSAMHSGDMRERCGKGVCSLVRSIKPELTLPKTSCVTRNED